MRVFAKVQGGIGKVELKEVAILLINSFASMLGYSAVLQNILFVFSREKIKFIKLFSVLYIAAIVVSYFAVAYLPILLVVVSFTYLCVKKIKLLHNILSCLLSITTFIIILAANNLISMIIGVPQDRLLELRETLSYNLYNSGVFLFFALISVLIINVISKRIHNLTILHDVDRSYVNNKLIVFVVVAIAFFIFTISNIWMLGMIDTQRAMFYTTFSIIISLLLSAFIVFAVYTIISITTQKKRELDIKHEKEITEIYKNEIQNMYDSVRDFKHDYMKIYSSMSMLIERGDIDGLRDFFNNEIVPLQNDILNETDTAHEITKISDSIIQGTVYNYIIKAKNKGIEPVISIDGDVPNTVSVTSVELARILGIILDNAIEAVCGIKDGTRKAVILGVYADKAHVTYIVKNTYSVQPDLSKIFDNDYSTKGGEHGRGLAIAKRITDKYDDVFLNVKLEKEYFVTELNLPIKTLF